MQLIDRWCIDAGTVVEPQSAILAKVVGKQGVGQDVGERPVQVGLAAEVIGVQACLLPIYPKRIGVFQPFGLPG